MYIHIIYIIIYIYLFFFMYLYLHICISCPKFRNCLWSDSKSHWFHPPAPSIPYLAGRSQDLIKLMKVMSRAQPCHCGPTCED